MAAAAAFACAAACLPGCGDDGAPAAGCRSSMDCGGDTCIDGRCVRLERDLGPSCEAPLRACGSLCVDTTTDFANCGGCGARCETGQRCEAGACANVCAAGETLCASGCADLERDEANCGSCGDACPARFSCAAGECRYECTPTSPPDEVCDGVDNDCDTVVDEPDCGAGLVGWWRMDQRAGPLADASGSGNAGAPTPRVQRAVPGKRGLAIGLDGFAETGVDIPDSASLAFPAGVTVEAWVRPDNCAHGASSYNAVAAKEWEFLLGFDNACSLTTYVRTAAATAASEPWTQDATGAVVPVRAWSHVALSYDGTTLRTFLDGLQVGPGAAAASPGALTDTDFRMFVGRRADCCEQTLSGFVDEVKVWNVARTEAEICADAGGAYTASPRACRLP